MPRRKPWYSLQPATLPWLKPALQLPKNPNEDDHADGENVARVMDDNIGQLSWDTNSSRIQLIQKPNDDDGDVGYGGDDHVVDYDDKDGKGQCLIKSGGIYIKSQPHQKLYFGRILQAAR